MNIYDIEFDLVNGTEGRALVKASSEKEARETLILGILDDGVSIDGNDVFDIIEVDILKEEGPRVAIIGMNKISRADIEVI